MPAHALQVRAADALRDAVQDVDMQPIGAGFRVVHFHTPSRSWRDTGELPYRQAMGRRARILAVKALELMGADPDVAEQVVERTDATRARRMVEAAVPVLGIR